MSNPTTISRSIRCLACILIGSTTIVGCREADEIARYEVLKPEVVQQANQGQLQKTLGAIVNRGSQMWFFKLSGSEIEVTAAEESFEKFVKSIRIDQNGEARWRLPRGWTEAVGGGQFRSATIQLGPDVNAQLTVSDFPIPTDAEEFTLLNVNRWRGQLQLEDIQKAELSELESVKLAGDDRAVVIRISGYKAPNLPPSAPFASVMKESRAPDQIVPAADSPQLQYEAPANWTALPAGGFRLAAFEVVDEQQQRVEITVIPLGPQSGSVFDNVERWRTELRLPKIEASELDEHVQEIQVGDDTATFAEMTGDVGGKPETTLAIMLRKPDRTWFIKLKGDAAVAREEKQRFLDFAKSIRIES